jgi:hypothetical protein
MLYVTVSATPNGLVSASIDVTAFVQVVWQEPDVHVDCPATLQLAQVAPPDPHELADCEA